MLSAEERLKFDKIKEKWSGYESKLLTYVTTCYQMFEFTQKIIRYFRSKSYQVVKSQMYLDGPRLSC